MQSKVLLSIGASFVFLIAVTISSFSETNTMEYTFCVNSKTKVVTYSKSGKCPKGNEPIQVGAKGLQGLQGEKGDVGPQGIAGPKGEAAVTSFNLLLRDGNGQLVQDLVADGSVYKDGRYWNLNYETGVFSPTFDYLYSSFFDSACKTDPVAILNYYTPLSAERELERLKTQSKFYPFIIWAGEQRFGQDFYSIPSGAKVVDNRGVATGPEYFEWTLKREIYFLNSSLDRCELNTNAFFYIDGITKLDIKIPNPLPAPIRWYRN
jgi:hypothetical protein